MTLYKEMGSVINQRIIYSASKSAAEQICIAYEKYLQNTLDDSECNERIRQKTTCGEIHTEMYSKIEKGEVIQIHSYPDKKTSGTRFYIHARNIASAVLFLIQKGSIGEKYNISGEREVII